MVDEVFKNNIEIIVLHQLNKRAQYGFHAIGILK